MKRKNLIVNEDLLLEAKKLLGAESLSAAVNQALAEAIMVARIRKLGSYFGTGMWQGNLGEMREDPPKSRRKSS